MNNSNLKNLIIIYLTKPIQIQDFADNFDKYHNTNTDVLCLTPYSAFLMETKNVQFLTFHDFLDKEFVRSKSVALLKDLDKLMANVLQDNLLYRYLYANYTLLSFISRNNFLTKQIENKYKNITIISNVEWKNQIDYDTKVDNSFLYLNLQNADFVKLEEVANTTLKVNRVKRFLKNLSVNSIASKVFKMNLLYDWVNFAKFILSLKPKKSILEANVFKNDIDISSDGFYDKYLLDEEKLKNLIATQVTKLLKTQKLKLSSNFLLTTMHMGDDTIRDYVVYKNGIKHFIWQHGSYLYKHPFFIYTEVNYNKINFVYNDFTKDFFESLGAKNVHTVGTILFNKEIKELPQEYDYMYITQGHDYSGNYQYVDFENSLHSFDGYELYQRHKDVVKLFGTKFCDKKIIIRLHPCTMGYGVYVPLWEIAKEYPNVTIDVSIPIHNIIEKTKYIISDYFTTEFVNRSLHHKRDTIMFGGVPTPIPTELVDDMQKMFILVDDVAQLEDTITNISDITKNMVKDTKVIEYYSSKDCDTKGIVQNILKEEINGR